MEYAINDKRGKEPAKEPCRVCGQTTHVNPYGTPNMNCIEFYREQEKKLKKAIEYLSEFQVNACACFGAGTCIICRGKAIYNEISK